jgi:hypothetical protein
MLPVPCICTVQIIFNIFYVGHSVVLYHVYKVVFNDISTNILFVLSDKVTGLQVSTTRLSSSGQYITYLVIETCSLVTWSDKTLINSCVHGDETLICTKLNLFRPTDAILKILFIVALLKLLKLYPYMCFDPRIIVRGFFSFWKLLSLQSHNFGESNSTYVLRQLKQTNIKT